MVKVKKYKGRKIRFVEVSLADEGYGWVIRTSKDTISSVEVYPSIFHALLAVHSWLCTEADPYDE